MRLNLLLIIAIAVLSLKSSAQPLFGLTTKGGSHGYGALFKFDNQSQTFTLLKSFNGNNGAEPSGKLLLASNGILYGITTVGGSSDEGTLFQYDPQTDVFTTLADFEYNTTGAYNFGSLIQLKNGDLVGVCSSGGVLGYGTIWKYSISENKIFKLKDFDDTTGAFPYSGVMQASNGMLYGLTSNYGPGDGGAFYEFNLTTNTFGLVQAFNSTNGSYGFGELTEVNGKLIGLTFLDGAHGMGTIFDYDLTNSVFTTRYSFDNANGGFPYGGGLSHATNGLLYGTTSGGGNYGDGTLFSYNPQSGSVSKVFDFDFHSSGASYSPVVQATNGNLYGMTERNYANGVYGQGSIYQFNIPSSTYTTLHHFENTNGGLPFWTGLTELRPVDPCTTDNIAPIVVTKNITIHLGPNGTANISASEIDNGSSDNCTISSFSLSKSSFQCGEVGDNEIFLTVTDKNGNTSKAAAHVTVVNDVPVITDIRVPGSPQNKSQAIEVKVTFTDENIKMGSISWGDGTTSAGVIDGASMKGQHYYTAAGIFSVSVFLTDVCLSETTSATKNIIIYDPNGRCLSGEGEINSENKDNHTENEGKSKGDFNIEVGYRGMAKPTGEFEFSLGYDHSSKDEKDDDHRQLSNRNSFTSTSFDWLIVKGNVTTAQGVGKVNGNSGYYFVFSAVDGSSHTDKLRVRIWNQSGIIYDNETTAPLYAEASYVISDGKIKIHDCDEEEDEDDEDEDEDEDDDGHGQKCQIDFFPNPISTHLTVSVKGGESETSFDLADNCGRHLQINPLPSSSPETHFFDLHDLPSGLYILTIRNGAQVSKKRFLKD